MSWNQPPGGYGAPPAQQGWGAPPPAQQGWGVPPQGAASGGWGAPAPAPAQNWGAPPPAQNWGAPAPAPAQNWGAAPPAQNWGAPPPQQNWGAAPPAQNWGAPPPGPQQGWGAPPPAQNWGAPPPGPQQGWGAPPPGPQQGWGAPPPGPQQGWGAPPPGPAGQDQSSQMRFGQTSAGGSGGNKKALLVGINYLAHQKGRLRGCINDVHNMKNLLTRYGFTGPNVKVMTDDLQDRNLMPTKQNMLRELRAMVASARPGDSLFFHFSGHGSQVVDTNGDEDDGLDETILPCDYNTAGQIIDDDLYDILVKGLPVGARLTSLMDCCHSGTGMDLPYVHVPGGGSSSKKDKKKKKKKKDKKKKNKASGSSGEVADVILFSGCRDDQTGADAFINGQATGAMTWAFTNCLNQGASHTYDGLLCAMRDLLNGGNGKTYTQVPQLSASRPIDPNRAFQL